MNLNRRIEALVALGRRLGDRDEELKAVIQQAYFHNRWFTEANTERAMDNIVQFFLDENALLQWAAAYKLPLSVVPQTVGIVMAGNIPLVGFHDFLCVFFAGHRAKIKLSDKDTVLMNFVFQSLIKICPEAAEYIEVVDRLTDFDAVIATGSNNTARYFEAYFGKYPNIIRRNRTSVSVLLGDETEEELLALGEDIFEYFGLGCRNVSKLYVPQGYNFEPLMKALHHYKEIVLHDKYKNNYDYSYTVLTMNKVPTIFGTCILLTENEALQPRIAQLFYSFYERIEAITPILVARREDIQCVVSRQAFEDLPCLGFGKTQQPQLTDYPDGVDTLRFLLSLS
jgi:hypothetical protein